jgi:RimJ/RimL family protein N-acetyltransferase
MSREPRLPPDTPRLTLRRFTPDDLEWLVTLYADEDVTRYLGGTRTRVEVEEMLARRIIEYYDRHPGFGIWMTLDRRTSEPLGFHLLNHIQGETIIQVGFALRREAWGRGVASEMAESLLRYAFTTLGLPHMVGMANRGNVVSQHVLEKIGLRRNGERAFAHPAYASQGPLAWFERDAADWLAER